MNIGKNDKIKESRRKLGKIKFIEKVEEFNINNEFTIVGEYTSRNENITIRHNCSEPHEFDINAGNFLKRQKCNVCHPANKAYTVKDFSLEFFKIYDDTDFEIIGPYKDNKTPIIIKCIKCNNTRLCRPVDLLHGSTKGVKTIHKCPICNCTSTSKYELQLRAYIEQFYDKEIKYNDRTILGNKKEIDIYLPDLKLGIEFNGLYWHNDDRKDKNYHLNKTVECFNQGIQLIHIFEDEWLNKRNIIENKLKYLLKHKVNDKKIYARKCFIEEVTPSIKNEFLENNHIQGKDVSHLNLGLWYTEGNEDILVAVMTFCKPRISLGQVNSSYDYELSRFATEMEYSVIGSFGKIFSYFLRNYDFTKIITYADKRWSVGKIYLSNSFNLIRESKPNYSYYDKNKPSKRLHRFSFRKSVLNKKFPKIYSDAKTEKTIMKEAGYSRVYDCGNMVFEYVK